MTTLENSCKIWHGATDSNGRAIRRVNGKVQAVARFLWEQHYGEIPAGLCVLHRCDNPRCIELLHLFLGSHQDNMDDKVLKGRAWKKLHPDSVDAIRSDTRIQRLIAKDFGISQSMVSVIKNGHSRVLL